MDRVPRNRVLARRSPRQCGFDYRTAGVYFVTIVTQQRTCWFGRIDQSTMRRSRFGDIARHEWLAIGNRHPSAALDAFVVMPNHLHGIVLLRRDGVVTLSEVVRSFKAATTLEIRRCGEPRFAWHRSYYDHIVRDDEDMNRIREYIADNPARWTLDREYRAQSST